MGFSYTVRVGSSPLEVTFRDLSSNPTEFRKWVFGDGECADSSTDSVTHVYTIPGVYSVKLIRGDSSYQDIVNMENLIYVNEVVINTNSVVAESGDTVGHSWCFGFDNVGRLFFESGGLTCITDEPQVIPNRWTFIEYHIDTDRFYVGRFVGGRKAISHGSIPTTRETIQPDKSFLKVLPNSSMVIDDLKITGQGKDLSEYFSNGRGRAGFLDPYIGNH